MSDQPTPPAYVEISEDEFHEKYRPQLKPSGDLLEFEDVRNAPLNTVWTIIEGDEPERDEGEEGEEDEDSPSAANWYAVPGFHVVNKMGYCLTEVPWEHENMQALYFDASDMD